MRVSPAASLLIIFGFVPLGLAAQTADLVLEKYFNSIGGTAKWKALKTIHYSGKVLNMRMGAEYPISIYQQAPDKVKQVSVINGEESVEVCTGTTAWEKEDGIVEKLSESAAKELRSNPFESPLIDYKTKGHEVILLGAEDVESVHCDKVLLKEKQANGEVKEETYYFEPKAHRLILRKRNSPIVGDLWLYYSDYREVSGLFFPFVTEAKVGGQLVQKRTLDKIALDEVFENNFFTMPPDSDDVQDSTSASVATSQPLPTENKTTVSSWREEDYKAVVQKLVSSLLSDQRLKEFSAALGRKPVVTFGDFKDEANHAIDVDALLRKFEYEFFKSNLIELLESTEVRNAVRKERAEQSDFEKDAALTKWGKEAGADLIFFGQLKLLTETNRGKTHDNYVVSLFLTDIVTNKRIWINQEEVKKLRRE